MIIGIIQVFRCDGVGCEVYTSVDMAAGLDEFETRWFVGMDRQFCPKCRYSLTNQAEIARQENALRDMGDRVGKRVLQEVKNAA